MKTKMCIQTFRWQRLAIGLKR